MRISDWSSDVCSSDLLVAKLQDAAGIAAIAAHDHAIVHAARQAAGRIRERPSRNRAIEGRGAIWVAGHQLIPDEASCRVAHHCAPAFSRLRSRSEEHTSELQSLMRTSYAVFCLKKKTT